VWDLQTPGELNAATTTIEIRQHSGVCFHLYSIHVVKYVETVAWRCTAGRGIATRGDDLGIEGRPCPFMWRLWKSYSLYLHPCCKLFHKYSLSTQAQLFARHARWVLIKFGKFELTYTYSWTANATQKKKHDDDENCNSADFTTEFHIKASDWIIWKLQRLRII